MYKPGHGVHMPTRLNLSSRSFFSKLRQSVLSMMLQVISFFSLRFYRDSTPRTEPFTMATMRAFLNQPVEPHTGVIECMIRRKKGVMSTVYQAYYEVSTAVLGGVT